MKVFIVVDDIPHSNFGDQDHHNAFCYFLNIESAIGQLIYEECDLLLLEKTSDFLYAQALLKYIGTYPRVVLW